MVMMTGKGGKYRYYQCSKIKNHGAHACTCKALPKESLDLAVREFLANEVFAEEQLLKVYDSIRELVKERKKAYLSEKTTLSASLNRLKQKFNGMIELVTSNTISKDKHFKELLRANQLQQQQLEQKLQAIEGLTNLPLKKFGRAQISAFAQKVKEHILTCSESDAKQLLMSVVEKVIVDSTGRVTATGPNFNLCYLISKEKGN